MEMWIVAGLYRVLDCSRFVHDVVDCSRFVYGVVDCSRFIWAKYGYYRTYAEESSRIAQHVATCVSPNGAVRSSCSTF